MAEQTADVVIIGGAVMGSSVACHLAQRDDFSGRIVVIEADPAYEICASARSAASVRQQFSCAINIEISLYGIQFLREIGSKLAIGGEKPVIDLHEGGYLFLATPDKLHILEKNHQLQQKLGADIAYLDQSGLRQKFPWLETNDLAAGCHGLTGEGWFDGYGLMQAFRKKARSLDVDYLSAKAEVQNNSKGDWTIKLSTGETLSTPIVVNCAGASGGAELCRQAGLDVPIVPRKRCVFPFECRDKLDGFPLLIDPNGTYVRPEGTGFICGSAPPEQDPDCRDFDVDYDLFEEHIWPTLAARVPAFEAIKPGAAWAGNYDMNLFDHNAFIGSVPDTEGFYLALGFSGHGLQQSPAIGRGLAELIVTGNYETLDLSELSVERLGKDQPIVEINVV
ncbi:MAG: FAD-binding oxidoreductase [Roseibium sp.]